ncbi:MAG TPA: hypothetical protein VFA18_02150 [Gemmataceae bacterium]|nr:hypothetical protein [Gemmataceae bacterium]
MDQRATDGALASRIHSLSSSLRGLRLSASLGKPVNAEWVRKTQQRAQVKFADLLIEEVARSLENDDTRALEEELRELDLLRYGRSGLAQRKE